MDSPHRSFRENRGEITFMSCLSSEWLFCDQYCMCSYKKKIIYFRGLKGMCKHIRTLEWKWKRDGTLVPSEMVSKTYLMSFLMSEFLGAFTSICIVYRRDSPERSFRENKGETIFMSCLSSDWLFRDQSCIYMRSFRGIWVKYFNHLKMNFSLKLRFCVAIDIISFLQLWKLGNFTW